MRYKCYFCGETVDGPSDPNHKRGCDATIDDEYEEEARYAELHF